MSYFVYVTSLSIEFNERESIFKVIFKMSINK